MKKKKRLNNRQKAKKIAGRSLAWIEGNGRFAVFAFCGGWTTAQLFDTRAMARHAKNRVDKTGCGGQCCNAHELIVL